MAVSVISLKLYQRIRKRERQVGRRRLCTDVTAASVVIADSGAFLSMCSNTLQALYLDRFSCIQYHAMGIYCKCDCPLSGRDANILCSTMNFFVSSWVLGGQISMFSCV